MRRAGLLRGVLFFGHAGIKTESRAVAIPFGKGEPRRAGGGAGFITPGGFVGGRPGVLRTPVGFGCVLQLKYRLTSVFKTQHFLDVGSRGTASTAVCAEAVQNLTMETHRSFSAHLEQRIAELSLPRSEAVRAPADPPAGARPMLVYLVVT